MSAKGNNPISWFAAKRPILSFVVFFALLLGAFYACTFIPFMNARALPGLQVLNAKVSAAILNLFGEGAHTQNASIVSSRTSVDIAHGCDAIEPAGLFVAAVLAFPASRRAKLPGVLIGTSLLLTLNLVRILSLFYVRIYYPAAFETMHIEVWQPAFIVLALFFWIVWAWWATQPKPVRADAPA